MTLSQRTLSALQRWLASSAGRRRRWTALVFWFGRRKVPFLRPLLTEGDITRVIAAVRPGDVLGVYTRRYVSSWLIPGRYKHTAIYLGHGMVAEAVAPRVRRLPLITFLRQYDRAVVWRPHYPDKQAWKAADRAAFRAMGQEYDPFFCDNNALWYCHEYAADCVSRGGVAVEKRGPQFLAEDIGRASACVLEVGYGVGGHQGA